MKKKKKKKIKLLDNKLLTVIFAGLLIYFLGAK